MLVKVICEILLYHRSWLLLFTPLHTHQLILWFYMSKFPGEMQLPTTTFRETFLKLQTTFLILIQRDRSLFSHLHLILLLPVCVTAMRHCWLCLPCPPSGNFTSLPMAGTPFHPSGGPHLCQQYRTPALEWSPVGSSQAFPSMACACPHPQGARGASVPSSHPTAGRGLRWDRLPGSCLAAPGHGLQGPHGVLKMCPQVLLEKHGDFIYTYIKITLAGVGNRCQCSDILSYLFPSSTCEKRNM